MSEHAVFRNPLATVIRAPAAMGQRIVAQPALPVSIASAAGPPTFKRAVPTPPTSDRTFVVRELARLETSAARRLTIVINNQLSEHQRGAQDRHLRPLLFAL